MALTIRAVQIHQGKGIPKIDECLKKQIIIITLMINHFL